MKRNFAVVLGTIALILAGTQFAAAQEKTFTGFVTDEQLNCIQNPMKAPTPDKGSPAWGKEACVLYWVHYATPKEKLALYDPDTKTTYHFDSEESMMPYAGDSQKVKVTGTLDEATKTIHVVRVE